MTGVQTCALPIWLTELRLLGVTVRVWSSHINSVVQVSTAWGRRDYDRKAIISSFILNDITAESAQRNCVAWTFYYNALHGRSVTMIILSNTYDPNFDLESLHYGSPYCTCSFMRSDSRARIAELNECTSQRSAVFQFLSVALRSIFFFDFSQAEKK